jgi:hypothetical protein
MHRCTLLALTLTLGALFCLAAQPPTTAAPAATDSIADALPPAVCEAIPLFKGDHSAWGRNLANFQGADLVVRTPQAWEAFWRKHTATITPAPPVPPVDFTAFLVVATIQGPQTSGGGPNTAILGLQYDGGFVHIRVFDDRRPGPLDVITNPFHIVLVRRACLPPNASIVFEHVAPAPGTGVVIGHVLAQAPDANPRPLAGAHVCLRNPDDESLTRHTHTGLDGSFFFVDVPPRGYELAADAPGFAPLAVPLLVPPDALVGRDLLLTPLPPAAGAIVGHVTQPGPAGVLPLPGATLQLTRDDQILATALADPNGDYSFNPVAPGPYVLRAFKVGFIPQAVALLLAPGQILEQSFLLVPESTNPFGRFVGRVWGTSSAGTQIPLGGATVRLQGTSAVVREVITNNEGRFVMEQVPPGPYLAVAQKTGWSRQQATVTIVAGQTTEQVFVLTPATALTLVSQPAP